MRDIICGLLCGFITTYIAVSARQEIVQLEQTPTVDTVFGTSRPALKENQLLIERHLYIAAIDTKARQPVWVSFTVHKRDWDTDNVLSRNFRTPKQLQDVSLEESDYDSSGFDLGHMYGLQFVSNSAYAAEVNEVQVIAAQRPDLNRRVWLQAENKIKDASFDNPVNVLTGQLWLKPMPKLSNADEEHSIASHCYVIMDPGPSGKEEAYLIPQDCDKDSPVADYVVEADELRDLISDKWTTAVRK